MEYNTQRNKLVMPEYGRNIQKMIRQCVEIEDRDERSRTAEAIVRVMAQMVPKVKETGEFWQKLWDHMYIISDFKLDVDSPYPMPDKEILTAKPKKVPYSDNNIKYLHYGKNIENIIQKAIDYPEGEEKDVLIRTIANHLKKSYLNWNRESVDDDLILQHLKDLSGGKLELSEKDQLSQTHAILAMNKKKKPQPVKNQRGRRK